MERNKKNIQNIKVFFLLGMTCFLLGCAAEEQFVKNDQLLSLHPLPLQGNFIIDEETVGCIKKGMAVKAKMSGNWLSNSFGWVYLISLHVTNQTPSIIEVNPKDVFARRADGKDSFKTVTGEDLIAMGKDRASRDYTRSLRDKATSESVMHAGIAGGYGGLAILGYMVSKQKEKELDKISKESSQLEDGFSRTMLFFTRLPREGFAEGIVFFFPKSSPFLMADDIIVQLYLEGEEFIFRFVDNTKTSPPK